MISVIKYTTKAASDDQRNEGKDKVEQALVNEVTLCLLSNLEFND